MEKSIELNRLLTALAVDAVNLQLVLDHGYIESRDALAGVAEPLRHLPEPIASTLAPPRQQVRRFELELGIVVGQSAQSRAAIGARVVNAGYESRFASVARRQSRVRIVIEQVPAPSAPA